MNRTIIISFLIALIISFSQCTSSNLKTNTNLPEYNKAIKILSASLKQKYLEAINKPEKKKLAVLTFVNDNNLQSQLGRSISNSLQTQIFDIKLFALLERERVDSLLSEYEFNESGLVNKVDSIKLGQLIGADLVLVGTIAPSSKGEISWFTITSRIVDLESGEILAITSIDMQSNKDLVAKYSLPIQKKVNDISGPYEIVLSDLIVSDEKSDGRAWDIDLTKPDIYLTISSNYSKTLESSIYYDSLEVTGDFFSGNILLEKDDSISISVYDYDIMETDEIGKIYITKSQIIQMLNKNEKTNFSFGQVKSISVKLEKKS